MLCVISFSILRKIVEREVHDKDRFSGVTRLAKIAKVLREFLSLICTIVEYSEI